MHVKLTHALIAGAANGGAIFVSQGDLAMAVSALVSTVTITLAVINWIDGRIDKKIKPLQDKLDKLYEHFVPSDEDKGKEG